MNKLVLLLAVDGDHHGKFLVACELADKKADLESFNYKYGKNLELIDSHL